MHTHIIAGGFSTFTHPVISARHFLNEGSCCFFSEDGLLGRKTVLFLFTVLENVWMGVVSAFKSFHMTDELFANTNMESQARKIGSELRFVAWNVNLRSAMGDACGRRE